jgi:hypothetical protein
LYNSQTQLMIPSWRVAVDNGGPYYVQAFSGAVDEPKDEDIGVNAAGSPIPVGNIK